LCVGISRQESRVSSLYVGISHDDSVMDLYCPRMRQVKMGVLL